MANSINKGANFDIFGVPVTYETHIFFWILVKMQIVEWDFKVILSMRMQFHA